jgi:hypothetical protein
MGDLAVGDIVRLKNADRTAIVVVILGARSARVRWFENGRSVRGVFPFDALEKITP